MVPLVRQSINPIYGANDWDYSSGKALPSPILRDTPPISLSRCRRTNVSGTQTLAQ